jgi:hypothetical protein
MAGTKRPSFLKSQKEQKRKMKAQEKREAKANKRAHAAENPGQGAPIEEMSQAFEGDLAVEPNEPNA